MQTVVITGGSAGIGRAVAEIYAGRGDRVGLIARGEERLHHAADALYALGSSKVEIVPVDVIEAADGVEVTLEQRVLSIRGRGEISLPGDLAPLYLEYQPGDYERAFTLSDTVDPAGIEARVRSGVLHLRLPKTGPAKRQRIEVRAD